MNDYTYLAHHGVKGMKWGVRKDKGYRSHGIRAAMARRSNEKVDKSFKKWKSESNKKANAIELGKKANQSRIKSELNRKDKSARDQFKADNKAYKKALRSNTTYRKGAIRGEVGKDLSRKYMSEAKKAKKAGDDKAYGKLMSKHDVQRAKARKAPMVGARRSQAKANLKRSMTVTAKAAATSAVIAGGVYAVNKYGSKNGVRISASQVNAVNDFVKKGKKLLKFIY